MRASVPERRGSNKDCCKHQSGTTSCNAQETSDILLAGQDRTLSAECLLGEAVVGEKGGLLSGLIALQGHREIGQDFSRHTGALDIFSSFFQLQIFNFMVGTLREIKDWG